MFGMSDSIFAMQMQGETPTVLFFACGMVIALFVVYYGFLGLNKTDSGKEETVVADSIEGYRHLKRKIHATWDPISRKHRLYLGALAIGLGIQQFGQAMNHSILGAPVIIALTYLAVFAVSFKHLIDGLSLDRQVIFYSLKAVQIEQSHPEWGAYEFREFVKERFQGFGFFSIVFFRMVVLSWVLFSAIDFGIISRFNEQWSTLGALSVSVIILGSIAWFLWKIGCNPYYQLKSELSLCR